MIPAQSRGAACRSLEAVGNGIDEVLIRQRVLGKAAVDGVAGEFGIVAEVFPAALAVSALSAGLVQPWDPDAGAQGVASRVPAAALNHSDDLMSWNYVRSLRRQFALHHVEVGPADAASVDFNEDLSFTGFRHGQF